MTEMRRNCRVIYKSIIINLIIYKSTKFVKFQFKQPGWCDSFKLYAWFERSIYMNKPNKWKGCDGRNLSKVSWQFKCPSLNKKCLSYLSTLFASCLIRVNHLHTILFYVSDLLADVLWCQDKFHICYLNALGGHFRTCCNQSFIGEKISLDEKGHCNFKRIVLFKNWNSFSICPIIKKLNNVYTFKCK